MCKVSEKLKLCTCDVQELDQLEHFWILRKSGTEPMLVGEIAMPAVIPKDHEMHNKATLRKLLNQGNCLDVDINPSEGDILELHFTCKSLVEFSEKMLWHGDYLAYAFNYRKGKWKSTRYDPHNESQELSNGKIDHALVP